MNDVAPTNVAPMKFGMGANPRRKEDKALITGAGRFTDDYTPEGTLRAWVLRSTMAHARIKVGDLADARALPGVRLILTAADVKGLGGLPCKGKVRQVDGTYPKIPAASAPRRRRRAPCRRSDRLHRRRRARAGQGRGGGDRGRLRSAAGRRRDARRRSPRTRRWSGPNTAPISPSRPPAATRQATDAAFAKAARVSRKSRSSTTASSPTTWRRAASSPNTTRAPTATP